ncbi:MFS transporter [Pandoraea sp.]|uniref:MFS transporter n=1 Tax=Pandoraea sp. TaxID=1883445 RepID=UPI0011FC2B15|nr:MFS transporter [Pandoraea sp.]MBU6491550.1 MFS transporter [Burkholderiales bacterium]MDE2288437.1 MFS transporter [Burkholderiales bacterium]MDE2608087.1 MFS transporter [Burkholderiales bacterium]TAL57241.1 MAG: MFS transporter [Pandoraea sp.]TAM16511.1 MAG: MFS transporter [Pandoraea sp.]
MDTSLKQGRQTPTPPGRAAENATVFGILGAISFSHLLNDMIQSLILAIYPLLKNSFDLSFGQIGLITLTYQMTASMLQPVVGFITDRRPQPYSLPVGMGFTLVGLLLLATAPNFGILLVAAALVGMGSSVFHPESSRVARMASGGRHGLAQSLFQVGGNAGTSLGPLLAALVIAPYGRGTVAWFSLAALLAIFVLIHVSRWYNAHRQGSRGKAATRRAGHAELPRNKVLFSLGILMLLIFSKYFYLASLNSYYTFYLIDKFHLSVQSAQIYLFIFLFSVAVGTLAGGPIGDRVGRKYVIWVSILGVTPFTLALPYANLFWTGVLTVVIGLVLASAFSAILVYAQELVPGKVGMIAGMFFGFAFGMGGIGAAVLGKLADATSIEFVYHVCSFLPLIGVLTALLPNLERPRHASA